MVYGKKNQGRMIHCNNATWDFLIGIRDAFSEEFMKGGPLGFTCKISDFPAHYKARWAEVIAEYKRERDFYRTATARILVDTDAILAIEYADTALSTCVIKLFTRVVHAKELILYPVLSASTAYRFGGELRSGADIMENGILLSDLLANDCITVTLYEEKE